MSPRRLAAGAAVGLALLLFWDKLIPGPAPTRPKDFGSAPLGEVLAKLPPRNVGRFAKPGDPLNLVFVGDAEQVEAALREAGWTRIPLRNCASVRAALGELLRGGMFRSFPPMNLYRLHGRFQDFNWSIPITPLAQRHHFRLWRSGWKDENRRDIWWGSANLDIAVRYWDLSHTPHPDMPAERAFIASTLEGSRWVASSRLQPVPQVPLEGVNDKGYPFHTDAKALVVVLKMP